MNIVWTDDDGARFRQPIFRTTENEHGIKNKNLKHFSVIERLGHSDTKLCAYMVSWLAAIFVIISTKMTRESDNFVVYLFLCYVLCIVLYHRIVNRVFWIYSRKQKRRSSNNNGKNWILNNNWYFGVLAESALRARDCSHLKRILICYFFFSIKMHINFTQKLFIST